MLHHRTVRCSIFGSLHAAMSMQAVTRGVGNVHAMIGR